MSGKKKTDAGSGSANAQPVSSSLARAVSLHLEGKRKEALRELNSAIENGEQGADIYAAKGHIQFELEQYDDAVKTYEKLLGAAPQHPTANFNLGICYEKLGRWQEASDSFQKALEVDPQRGSQPRLGHLLAPSGKAGAGHRLLRQSPGIESRARDCAIRKGRRLTIAVEVR